MAHVSAIKKMAEWEVDNCVCSYQVYESIWVAALGGRIVCIREPLIFIKLWRVTWSYLLVIKGVTDSIEPVSQLSSLFSEHIKII